MKAKLPMMSLACVLMGYPLPSPEKFWYLEVNFAGLIQKYRGKVHRVYFGVNSGGALMSVGWSRKRDAHGWFVEVVVRGSHTCESGQSSWGALCKWNQRPETAQKKRSVIRQQDQRVNRIHYTLSRKNINKCFELWSISNHIFHMGMQNVQKLEKKC